MGIGRKRKIVCELQGAWLITWEWAGDHARPPKEMVSIINSHTPAEWVQRYVEQIYADQKYDLSEQCAHAKPKQKQFNPYPAKLYGGYYERPHIHITCGHNPSLLARKVKNIKVIEIGPRNEVLECEEYDYTQKKWRKRIYK